MKWLQEEKEVILEHHAEPLTDWEHLLPCCTRRMIISQGERMGLCIYVKRENGNINHGFWARVTKGDSKSCWNWTGGKNEKGYGALRFLGERILAHRLSWIIHNGPIPEHDSYHGFCILHRCDNPSCVNPDHLFLGTHQDNMDDMVAKNRHASAKSKRSKNEHE